MKNFYLTRHGETYWNVANKICGATDIGLTVRGHQQAIACGEMIKKEYEDIDEILYSPLIRAKDTAMHIASVTGLPARPEERLREQSFGRFEGTARDGQEFYEAKKAFCYHFDGGESMLQVAQRVYDLLDEIKESDKVYLLVAHNGLTRVITSYFEDLSNDAFAALGIKNCEVKKFTFK